MEINITILYNYNVYWKILLDRGNGMSNIKANRTFTIWRKYGWLLTIIIAFGGLYEHKLGLIVPFFVMLGLMITSLFNGRFWCGNVCPHGSLYDSVLLRFSKNEDIPKSLRNKGVIIAIFILFAIVLGTRVYKVFSNFSGLDLLDKFGFIFVTTYLVVLLVSTPLALFIAPRTWCQFCPMGTIQKLFGKLGQNIGISKNTNKKLTILDKDKCIKCKKCAKVCPMQLQPYLEFNEQNQFDNENCIKCNTCVNNCPKKILTIKSLKGER